MNIFCVSDCPIEAAKSLVDRHVIKMILESAQMLANCFHWEMLKDAPKTKRGTPWKYAHWNHPCSKWVRESKSNMTWLLDHALALCQEKEFRYPKNAPHHSKQFLNWVKDNLDKSTTKNNKKTQFAVAIKSESECRKNPIFDSLDRIEQYRLYYIKDKKHIAKWTKREKPEWF